HSWYRVGPMDPVGARSMALPATIDPTTLATCLFSHYLIGSGIHDKDSLPVPFQLSQQFPLGVPHRTLAPTQKTIAGPNTVGHEYRHAILLGDMGKVFHCLCNAVMGFGYTGQIDIPAQAHGPGRMFGLKGFKTDCRGHFFAPYRK